MADSSGSAPSFQADDVRGTVDPELWFEDVVLLAEFVAGDYKMSAASVDPDDDKYLAARSRGARPLS